MVLSESQLIWKKIEKSESKEQKKLLRWQLQAREPILRFSDMKAGDHLVRKNSSLGGIIPYEHHFICIGSECDGRPKIVHYYNTRRNAIAQLFPTSLGSGTASEDLGIVQEMTLPHKDFIKSEDELQAKGAEVERVVWPEELKRYSTEEVVRRAEKGRLSEKYYNVVKNNCESFVMWCLCGLNITLQVTPPRIILYETGSAFFKMIRQGLQQVVKICTDLADDFAVAVGRAGAGLRALPKAGICVGSAITVLVEAIIAGYDIHSAYKKWQDGVLIKSREDFIQEVADKILLFLFRSGGTIAGMFVGQLLIPIPILGGLVGALVGGLFGHIIGKASSATIKETLARKIDSILAKALPDK